MCKVLKKVTYLGTVKIILKILCNKTVMRRQISRVLIEKLT